MPASPGRACAGTGSPGSRRTRSTCTTARETTLGVVSSPRTSPGSDAGPGDGADHDERLTVPWWWWPPALLIAVLMAAELHMGYPGVRSWLPYVLLLPLAAAVLIW